MAQNEHFPSASLYVGDLAPEVNEALLFEIFNAVGPVASIRVCRDAVTRRSLGYAYVNFHNVVDAERALDSMNYSQIGNRACRIMWSQRDPSLRKSGLGNIFVKNLDASIDHKTLYDTFSVFGNILSCKVSTNSAGESLGYGFVHYETDESAIKAIENANGMVIADHKVHVARFKPKAERSGDEDTAFTNLYVKNLPEDFTEEKLKEKFEAFGAITSSMLSFDEDGSFKGFAFVNYEKPEDAKAAVDKLNETEFEGKELFVGKAMKRTERNQVLSDKFEKLKLEKQKKWAGCNLYVKNLSDTIDEAALRAEFEKFGELSSVRIMMDANNRSKGFGFVCFNESECAAKALQEMNGALIDKKPVYVALAQRKEYRRAQLEAQYAHRSNIGAQQMPPAMFPAAGPMYFGGPQAMPAQQQRFMYPAQNMVPPRRWPSQVPYGAPQGQPQAQVPRGRKGPSNRGEPAQVPAGGQVADQPLQLTIQALAAASPEDQKQIIGERLFPLILELEPVRSGKITGMLLEMDNSDLLDLLESHEALKDKVHEAVVVLEAHEGSA